MSRLSLTRMKIYDTVARQLHGVVPCWLCGEPVARDAATLEHIKPLSKGGNSHRDNLAISHDSCNHKRHAQAAAVIPAQAGIQSIEEDALDPRLRGDDDG